MKCIFNQDTGLVYTYVTELQDHTLMMDNWSNTDVIDIEFIPSKKQVWDYKVDVTTRQLIKVS